MGHGVFCLDIPRRSLAYHVQLSVEATTNRTKTSRLMGEGSMAADPPANAALTVERIDTRRRVLRGFLSLSPAELFGELRLSSVASVFSSDRRSSFAFSNSA